MILKELLGNLRKEVRILLKDRNDHEICICKSDQKGIIPYQDMEVKEWMPVKGNYMADVDVIINIDDEIKS